MLVSIVLVLTACGGVFFYPQTAHVLSPAEINIPYQDLYFETADGVRLHGWRLTAQTKRKGTVLHFHGNAENISTHFASVYWLPAAGYEVLTFDYRGFGHSEGRARLPEVIEDGKAAIRYAQQAPELDNGCLLLIGQSIGGAIALASLDALKTPQLVDAVVLDSSFGDFQQIVEEVLRHRWWQRPLIPFLRVLLPRIPRPLDAFEVIKGMPVLIIHGTQDGIVPMKFSEQLYASAYQPKDIWQVPEGKHIDVFTRPEYRLRLLRYFDAHCGHASEVEFRGVALQTTDRERRLD